MCPDDPTLSFCSSIARRFTCYRQNNFLIFVLYLQPLSQRRNFSTTKKITSCLMPVQPRSQALCPSKDVHSHFRPQNSLVKCASAILFAKFQPANCEHATSILYQYLYLLTEKILATCEIPSYKIPNAAAQF